MLTSWVVYPSDWNRLLSMLLLLDADENCKLHQSFAQFTILGVTLWKKSLDWDLSIWIWNPISHDGLLLHFTTKTFIFLIPFSSVSNPIIFPYDLRVDFSSIHWTQLELNLLLKKREVRQQKVDHFLKRVTYLRSGCMSRATNFSPSGSSFIVSNTDWPKIQAQVWPNALLMGHLLLQADMNLVPAFICMNYCCHKICIQLFLLPGDRLADHPHYT